MGIKERMKVALGDMMDLAAKGHFLYDPASMGHPLHPLAPRDHYDEFARAIIAFIRTDPRSDDELVEVLIPTLMTAERGTDTRQHWLKMVKNHHNDPSENWVSIYHMYVEKAEELGVKMPPLVPNS